MPQLDWSKRAEYVRLRHGVELTPDPASWSGRLVRVIGYSITAREVLTVILVAADVDVTERPAGDWSGSNAGVASPRDRRLYGKEN